LSGKDGLEAAVAALLGGAACGFSLDEVEFAALGIFFGAVGQFAGEASAVEDTFAAREVPGFAGRFAAREQRRWLC